MVKNDAVLKSRPTCFSVKRCMEFTMGIMHQGDYDDKKSEYQDIPIYHTAGLGSKMSDGVKEEDMGEPNPYKGDICYLNYDSNAIQMNFCVTFFPLNEAVISCNDMAYNKAYVDFVNNNNKYCEELAKRYLYNLLVGKFWWRNRDYAEDIETQFYDNHKQYMTKVNSFEYSEKNTIIDNTVDVDFAEIYDNIVKTFKGEKHIYKFYVKSYLKTHNGANVYPSQEMPRDLGVKEKMLCEYCGTAAFHDRKIANAIASVDTWYDDFDDWQVSLFPTEYGTYRKANEATRSEHKASFYGLIDKAIINNETLTDEEMWYIFAVIIRGGMFQKQSDKNKKGDK